MARRGRTAGQARQAPFAPKQRLQLRAPGRTKRKYSSRIRQPASSRPPSERKNDAILNAIMTWTELPHFNADSLSERKCCVARRGGLCSPARCRGGIMNSRASPTDGRTTSNRVRGKRRRRCEYGRRKVCARPAYRRSPYNPRPRDARHDRPRARENPIAHRAPRKHRAHAAAACRRTGIFREFGQARTIRRKPCGDGYSRRRGLRCRQLYRDQRRRKRPRAPRRPRQRIEARRRREHWKRQSDSALRRICVAVRES